MSAGQTRLAVAVGLAATALAVGAGSISAQAATPQKLSAQDKAFIASNAQSNLAELALGVIGEERAQDSRTKELAEVTLKDHQTLETHLAQLATTDGVTLPLTPNAMQQAIAATLKATPLAAFDLAYARAEVTGHQMAIAVAKTEESAGSASGVKDYASGYVPIATMHLEMASADVAALTGAAPTSVSAGTGGRAATDTAGSPLLWVGVGAGAVIAIGSAGAALRSRRRVSAAA